MTRMISRFCSSILGSCQRGIWLAQEKIMKFYSLETCFFSPFPSISTTPETLTGGQKPSGSTVNRKKACTFAFLSRKKKIKAKAYKALKRKGRITCYSAWTTEQNMWTLLEPTTAMLAAPAAGSEPNQFASRGKMRANKNINDNTCLNGIHTGRKSLPWDVVISVLFWAPLWAQWMQKYFHKFFFTKTDFNFQLDRRWNKSGACFLRCLFPLHWHV